MRSQSFFIRTGEDGTASYQVIVPVLNMEEGYSLRVKAEDGADVPCTVSESGEYVIERKDGPGQFKARVAIVDKKGTVCDERLIEVSCSKGTDPSIMRAVGGVLEKQAAPSMTVGNAFSDVHTKARGEDIAAACEYYLSSDATADSRLRCLAYLQAAAGSAYVKDHVARLMDVINDALDSEESGDHPIYAVNIGLKVNVPSPIKFSFLNRALRCSFANTSSYQSILAALVNLTPSSERQKVAAVACDLLVQHADFGLQVQALNLISVFGYRNALPAIRELLTSSVDVNLLRQIVQVLLSWNDTASASQLMELLDLTNYPPLAEQVLLALKQFSYREAIPRIEAMIPVSGVEKARVLEAGLKAWK